ncbi:MAG TPA: DUF3131 domain-containing protein [Noviherbaspirillum sp.]|jgi:hypothetical protein|uniref:DUF3131 domain-containing protein n=1 Tax=Noviherbaspirillum sp. TaxID=1926288 RepID=UPI002DDDB3C2|nr:DUF3131 domain-containing protein [Noviherbaspirillum sp.]HEV2611028.1 DUF3131 domain-containing protein [Noviherbaspirillum sp.]
MKRPDLRILIAASIVLLNGIGAAQAASCTKGELPAARYPQRSGPLNEAEMTMARNAWKYFENNLQPESGLVNAVDGYPSTTMWDTASYLAAIVAANDLGVIDREQARKRIGAVIATFNRMSFFRDELPNKVYHAKTVEKADYSNKPGEIGFSAIDLGRLLIWLKIVKERYPEHADGIDRFVLRWKFDKIVDRAGTLYGARVDDKNRTEYVQEGRLGYEEYAAKGFELWGISTEQASRPEPYETISTYCVDVPFDSRDPRKTSQHNYVVSESYVLDGIEFNWDLARDRDTDDRRHSHEWIVRFAHRVYQAQENRHRETGILTARSEHQLDQEPYFVYDTVYSDGYAWNTITDTGKHVPQFAAVSLKAALGMWVIWKSDYTDLLFRTIATAVDPAKGYYEGILENGKGPIKTFTANNNGIMLEALLYKAKGKILKWGPRREGLWEKTFNQPYGNDAQARFSLRKAENCVPGEQGGEAKPC